MSNEFAYQVIPAGRATPGDFAEVEQLVAAWGTDGNEDTRRAYAALCIAGALTPSIVPESEAQASKTGSNTALVPCVLRTDPKRILGALIIIPQADHMLDAAFAEPRDAYLQSCKAHDMQPLHLGEPMPGIILRPSAVQWSAQTALGGPSIPMITTDPQAGPGVVDTLIRGVRAYQESLDKDDRKGYTLALHGDDESRYYDLCLGNGLTEMAHNPHPSPIPPTTDLTSGQEQEPREHPATVYLRLKPSNSGIRSLRHTGLGEQRYEIVQRISNTFQAHLQAKAMAEVHAQDGEGLERYAEAARKALLEHKALFDLQGYVERRDRDC